MVKQKVLFSITALIVLFSSNSFSQKKDSSVIKIIGYVDAYYAHYSDSVGRNNFQKFPATCPRSDAFGLNIVQLIAQYDSKYVRSTATIHFGDLPSAAWSPVFNFIQEANVGARLAKKTWLDAGFFKTHIGTEALLPKDNIATSISIITDYEPWWQAGAKLSYNPNDKLQTSLYLVNGYNVFTPVNKKKAVGLALTYSIGDKGTIGYYNFLSDDTPDSVKTSHWRFLNNLVFTYQITKSLKAIIGVDYISQQHSVITDTAKNAYVYSYIVTMKYQVDKHWGIYARAEMFSDRQGILTGIIPDSNNKLTGYVLYGETVGIEYKPTAFSYIRAEGRELEMDKNQKIFRTEGANTNMRMELMVNMGISF